MADDLEDRARKAAVKILAALRYIPPAESEEVYEYLLERIGFALGMESAFDRFLGRLITTDNLKRGYVRAAKLKLS